MLSHVIDNGGTQSPVYIPVSFSQSVYREGSDGGTYTFPIDMSLLGYGAYLVVTSLSVTAKITTSSGSYLTTVVAVDDGKYCQWFGEVATANTTKTFTTQFNSRRFVEIVGDYTVNGISHGNSSKEFADSSFYLRFSQNYGNWGRNSTVVYTVSGGINFYPLI